MQIDFSTAFDRVTHQGIIYKLCSVCILCSVLSVLLQFLSNPKQHVMVDVLSGRPLCCIVLVVRYCFSGTPRSFSNTGE